MTATVALVAPENRAFTAAVLASIVLHGLLLLTMPGLRDQRSAAVPGPIVARLVPRPSTVAAPRPVEEPPKPVAKPDEPRPTPVKPVPAPAAKQAPVTKPAPAPKPAAPASSAPAPAEPAPAAPAAQQAPATPSAAPAPAAVPSQDTADAGMLARFRLEIIGAARRYKRYPRVAMDNNWEGRVDVRITFGADGRRASIAVTRSSGHDVLDKQAVDTVTKAFVPVPAALRGREFTVDIPVIYNLKDPDA